MRRAGTVVLLLVVLVLLGVRVWRGAWPGQSAPARHAAFSGEAAHATHGHRTAPSAAVRARPRVAGQAGDDASCHRELRSAYTAVRDAIDRTASPDDAVRHALLTRMLATASTPGAASRDLEQAAQRWPDNVDIAWLRHQACLDRRGCDRNAALHHLQRLDGDNLFAWLPALADAYRAGDAGRFEQVLRRASTAPVLDSRLGTMFLAVRPILGEVALPASCASAGGMRQLARSTRRPLDATLQADVEAYSIDLAYAMPALAGVSGCRGDAFALTPHGVDDCKRVLARLADGDTFAEQGVALRLLVLLTRDDAAGATWRERYRQLLYLQGFVVEVDRIDGWLGRAWIEGEVAVLRAYAGRTGRWPPPPHWLPARVEQRALLEGHGAH